MGRNVAGRNVAGRNVVWGETSHGEKCRGEKRRREKCRGEKRLLGINVAQPYHMEHNVFKPKTINRNNLKTQIPTFTPDFLLFKIESDAFLYNQRILVQGKNVALRIMEFGKAIRKRGNLVLILTIFFQVLYRIGR